mmetsp:Transcript_8557/g.7902  ORF Transcript_8557/g.7902 Transcript_8557/m.7902 type:complete len:133 (+) Transcript_8557:233-631(+)
MRALGASREVPLGLTPFEALSPQEVGAHSLIILNGFEVLSDLQGLVHLGVLVHVLLDDQVAYFVLGRLGQDKHVVVHHLLDHLVVTILTPFHDQCMIDAQQQLQLDSFQRLPGKEIKFDSFDGGHVLSLLAA